MARSAFNGDAPEGAKVRALISFPSMLPAPVARLWRTIARTIPPSGPGPRRRCFTTTPHNFSGGMRANLLKTGTVDDGAREIASAANRRG